MQTGTLKELDVKPGDVVEAVSNPDPSVVGLNFTIDESGGACGTALGSCTRFDPSFDSLYGRKFRIISRADDTPKTWGEMTDAEKGALLLAWQRGKAMQYWNCDDEEWQDTDIHPHEFDADAYRIKPTPERKTITLGWEESLGVGNGFTDGDTYRITFDTIDGKPDCTTVKMEAVEQC